MHCSPEEHPIRWNLNLESVRNPNYSHYSEAERVSHAFLSLSHSLTDPKLIQHKANICWTPCTIVCTSSPNRSLSSWQLISEEEIRPLDAKNTHFRARLLPKYIDCETGRNRSRSLLRIRSGQTILAIRLFTGALPQGPLDVMVIVHQTDRLSQRISLSIREWCNNRGGHQEMYHEIRKRKSGWTCVTMPAP